VFDVTIGGTPSRKEPTYWNGDIPWVSSGEVAFCRISQTREQVTAVGVKNSNAKILPVGTVLLGMIGEGKTRGQAAILDVPATSNQNVAVILCAATPILPEWLLYWFMASYEQTRGGGVGGAQAALSSERVRHLVFPLAPLAEQRRIVARVESLLSQATVIEQAVAAVSRRIADVERAVLVRAFRGELTDEA
jgi:type I restriction enzyme S subunit